MEDGPKDVVNHDPSFGSSLLSDNFGQRPTGDEISSALDLEAAVGSLLQESTSAGDRATSDMSSENGAQELGDPLLRNPDGATQRFSDMHGKAGEVAELAPGSDMLLATTGMKNMAALTVGTRKVGNTDWGVGTDGGRSGKPESDGVPYGSFAGV